MFQSAVQELVNYGVKSGLLPTEEKVYATNQILDLFHEDGFDPEVPVGDSRDLETILKELLDYAAEKGLLEENTTVFRDLFDSKLMNTLIPRPSTVIQRFSQLYQKDPKQATDYFYQLSQDSNYIRRYRISKDIHWTVESVYGDIEISINLSKPEKDPKDIARAKNTISNGYPKCLLCKENEGYAGNANHPGRSNHRIIPLDLAGARWGLQYSPYVYYNEHCILFNMEHIPMKVERATFVKLLDFVEMFPHYMLGSNADLPIVGGSILSHDHYQGGGHEFPMAKAKIAEKVSISGFEDVETGILNWPLTVIRISSGNKDRLVNLADKILCTWREYTDASQVIFAHTNGEPHNTITPIARMRNGKFELDLVLRNNMITEERPMGLYHPREEYHHIKRENIGLIEVMGLAILPSRLKRELSMVQEAILEKKNIADISEIAKHAEWVDSWKNSYGILTEENLPKIIDNEVGNVFVKVLEDCGVYSCDESGRKGVKKFLSTVK